jgi:hypothetical protein
MVYSVSDYTFLKINAVYQENLLGDYMLQFLDDGVGMNHGRCNIFLCNDVSDNPAIKN